MHYLYLVEVRGTQPYYEIGSTYNLRYNLRLLERALRLPVLLRLSAKIQGPEVVSYFHTHPIFQAWSLPLRVHGISRPAAYKIHPIFTYYLGEFIKVCCQGELWIDPHFDWTQEAMEVDLPSR